MSRMSGSPPQRRRSCGAAPSTSVRHRRPQGRPRPAAPQGRTSARERASLYSVMPAGFTAARRLILYRVSGIDAAMSSPSISRLDFLFEHKAECMPRADMAALQLARLKQTLAHAYARVPHVRAKFDAAGTAPDRLKTLADIDLWSGLMARSLACGGARPGDVLHNAYGYGLFTGGLGAHYGAERLGCTVVPVSGGMTERQVQLINDFSPDIITVT